MKWQVFKSESILENGTHKILWDFEIQTDHLKPSRWPDQAIITPKISWPQIENQRKQKERPVLRPVKRTKNVVDDGNTSCNWHV